MVSNPLVGKARGGHELDDMESCPGHVVEVEGAEVRELLEGSGLGVRVGGLDLAADILHGLRDEGRLADELETKALDEVLECALEESLHE